MAKENKNLNELRNVFEISLKQKRIEKEKTTRLTIACVTLLILSILCVYAIMLVYPTETEIDCSGTIMGDLSFTHREVEILENKTWRVNRPFSSKIDSTNSSLINEPEFDKLTINKLGGNCKIKVKAPVYVLQQLDLTTLK